MFKLDTADYIPDVLFFKPKTVQINGNSIPSTYKVIVVERIDPNGKRP